jgi:Cof subfamily protein (haloacid dehalogenase superfamily)
MTLVAPSTDDFPMESPILDSTECRGILPLYRMVALDLDGTLLQSNHTMADEQASYLRDLQRRGFTVCIATGRALPSVYEHVQKLNLPVPIPVVCSNGAIGLLCSPDLSTRQELFSDPVPLHLVQRAMRLGHQMGHATQYYFEDDIYCNQQNEMHYHLTGLYTELTGSQVHHVDDDFESLLSQGKLPSKILILFHSKHNAETFAAFTKEFENEATVVGGTYDWFVEILNPVVTKGHGLAKMCEALGIPMEQCVAMGDGDNDVEFLQMAGRGIAMNNARDVTKQVADEVMDWNNDEHGVMKTLQRLEQQGLLHLDKN